VSTPSPIRLYLWPQRVLYMGQSPDNDLHRHHAAQLCVSLSGVLRVHSMGAMLESTAVVVAPDHPHRIDAGGARILAIYLEPESVEYASLISPMLNVNDSEQLHTFDLSPEDLQLIRNLDATGLDPNRAWNLCASALGLAKSPTQHRTRDARIEQVIATIRSEPSAAHSVDRLAASVHLSPSRLGHLFRDQVGVPIRRFTVWSRMRRVVQLALEGATLTDAAHAAGFSDAAHMSNTFRQMFGFAPSALFAKRMRKDIQLIT